MLNIPFQKVEHLNTEAFSKMKKLRLIKIGNEKLPKNFINGSMLLRKDLIRGNLQLPQDLNYLSNELRVIEWHGYHLKSTPTKQTCGIENALQWHQTTMERKYVRF